MKYIKRFENYEDKSKIIELNLSNKSLTELPDLSEYTSLKILYCYSNKLTSLPDLPDSLECLDCDDNQLTSLPDLPDSLKWLYCHDNKLTSLPDLPDTLKYLCCDNNKLTSLPDLPDSLEYLDCENNQIPYDNLVEYKEWKEEPETFEAKKASKKYNL